MEVELKSSAEKKAKEAERLPAFGGLNLLHIKRQLAEMLKLIGRDGIFDDYTVHNIKHVDKMLELTEWLIPDNTKEIMTATDWLLIVLCIYFHDLGMLVTPEEFKRRGESGFEKFKETELFSGEEGEEYRHKINVLGEEDRERFLYQEFVRKYHADRIRWWIEGYANTQLGFTNKIAKEIDDLLNSLGKQFRKDIGLIAESHHLPDLDNITKYKLSVPYGDSEGETGNLQYAAVILRVSDLLHITSDRTPAIAFRLIDPIDPMSQNEWAKQMAVKRVRAKIGLDEDGNQDPTLPRNTIEVHAYFEKEDGFFGLTSYLSYAASELTKCHQWIDTTRKMNLAMHEFPWTKLDDSNIVTHGFMRDEFRFTIDQAKILDLLTGHTLYNDSSVVLRELVQNSLDAIRLQHFDKTDSPAGEVRITWNSKERLLTVIDNGTGMTQETIQNHLLRVGASLYQDPEFKKNHQGFSSISRFGIGVLSTFMIADSVEIITCHPNEDVTRRLALRSVHGKYLMYLLDKNSETVRILSPHGTLVQLRVRQSVEKLNVMEMAQYWVMIPGCKVTVQIDEMEPVAIGYQSPKEAIVSWLREAGYNVVDKMDDLTSTMAEDAVFVVERNSPDASIAYAVQWSPYFHNWSFMNMEYLAQGKAKAPIGICLHGICIDRNTPGYKANSIFAFVNAYGINCPRTNVARSGIEATHERDALIASVYRAYCTHAESEIEKLFKNRGHSLTWAVQEAGYLLNALVPTPDSSVVSH